jgi:hypothetical protein
MVNLRGTITLSDLELSYDVAKVVAAMTQVLGELAKVPTPGSLATEQGQVAMPETLKARLEWLTNLEPGTVWTEYHWREALQLEQEVTDLGDRLLDLLEKNM